MKLLSLVALIGVCVLAAPQSQFRSTRDVTEDLFNAVTFACAEYSDPSFINQEIGTTLGEFPWMAALLYFASDTFTNEIKCGGTIISEQFILTAAHCVEKGNEPIAVLLGGVSLEDRNAIIYRIKKFIPHPKYSYATGRNDIALIQVDRQIIFTPFVWPACVETLLSDEPTNVNLTVTGWGSTSAERTRPSKHLLKTQVTTVPLAECNATYIRYDSEGINTAYRNGIHESQYCARDPTGSSGSCHGDSGGPLQIFRNPRIAHVIGIVSFGNICVTTPTVHTRVAYYADWIASHVFLIASNKMTEN